LSLLKYSNECEGVGIDISKEALAVARDNASRLGLEVEFLCGDLFEPLDGFVSKKTTDRLFDMIVSNPPYIETAVIPTLMPEVKDHEPILALDGSGDGLYFYRKIVDKSVGYMRKGGYLFFEIGYNQGDAVSRLMCDAGFSQVKVIKDYAGLDRVVMGIYS
jgi:release factor glutamine methyltransferase